MLGADFDFDMEVEFAAVAFAEDGWADLEDDAAHTGQTIDVGGVSKLL